MPAPTIQAKNIQFANPTADSIQIVGIERGDGEFCIIMLRPPGQSGTITPIDGVGPPQPGSQYGQFGGASQFAGSPDWSCVKVINLSSPLPVTVTGLVSGTWSARAFEGNTSEDGAFYLANADEGNPTTFEISEQGGGRQELHRAQQ